jgi:hypothetical protein
MESLPAFDDRTKKGRRPTNPGLRYLLRMPFKKMLRKFLMTSSWVALG